MTAIDNSVLIAPLIDDEDDGDTFWYTELLDRAIKGRSKLLRTFEHNSRAHFLDRMPTIRKLCDQTGTRAYTRLSPRSRKQVAHYFASNVLERVLAGSYDQLHRAYASACGKTAIHGRKLWIFDCDAEDVGAPSAAISIALRERDAWVTMIPTKHGMHLIAKPHHVDYELHGVNIHKDNPTCTYIPEGAA